jgi:hypothetical protein
LAGAHQGIGYAEIDTGSWNFALYFASSPVHFVLQESRRGPTKPDYTELDLVPIGGICVCE